MDRKVISTIILILILISVVVYMYSCIQYNKNYVDLAQHKAVELEMKDEIPVINDVPAVKEHEYVSYDVPGTSGFKSYMDYRTITSVDSRQYRLQNEYAYTGYYGIRMVDDRYCIAVGSHFTSDVGRYLDLVLENGTVIPCILADQKADIHTDESNIVTMHNGCASEFIVNTDFLDETAKIYGNISWCNNDWDSPVKEVRVYDNNIFNE